MKFDKSPKIHLANAKPTQLPRHNQLDRESSRLLIDTLSHGILMASRQPQESPAAKQLVKDVSRTGAEFVVNLVNTGHKTPHPIELGRQVHALQQADKHMFPDLPYVDNPTTGVNQDELRRLMGGHADRVTRVSDSLPEENRVNREDAALAILEIMSAFVEENPSGLQLNPQAAEQLGRMAQTFDAAFPEQQ